MRLVIVTPAPPGTRHGNRATALRWARHLRALGHSVSVVVQWDSRDCDAMIALHARRSHGSMKRWRAVYPGRPLVLVLTGTDLYGDIRTDAGARESLALADCMVVLQPMGLDELDPALRGKTRVIYQSVRPLRRGKPPRSTFLVTVIGHLREVKDPFRAAYALKYLPPESRIRVVQLGAAMSQESDREARSLMRTEPRYRWLGERDHAGAMRWLGRSHAMVISSRMEGGAHVVSEAIAAGVPVIASDIAGNIGLLAGDYPGYYPVGNEQALAALLTRAESDSEFLHSLEAAVKARRSVTDPAAERRAIADLVAALPFAMGKMGSE
jgi:putative glycosyltransferase (TIGR04348 family)